MLTVFQLRFMASSHVVMGHLFARGVIEPLYFFGWGFTWVYLSYRDLMVAVCCWGLCWRLENDGKCMSIIVDLYKAFSGMRKVKSEAWCQDDVKTEAMVLHAEWLRAFLGVFEQTQDRFYVWVAWRQEIHSNCMMIQTRKHTTIITCARAMYTAYGWVSAKVCLAAEWHNLPIVCFCFVLRALSINVSINLADVKYLLLRGSLSRFLKLCLQDLLSFFLSFQ